MKQQLENILADFNANQFQNDLIEWFAAEQRDLPWRKDQDPYKVWVSEIMLQQTRVDTVIPYFNAFISKFPTATSLAAAEEEEVLKAWEGLGYYSRARNLQAAVKEVVDAYDGIVPSNQDEISKLKGVGPYTAGAILSIAYNKPEPAVDGNVMRVLSRLLSVWDDIAKPKTRTLFEKIVREIISSSNPSAFNQGLMELGALICTPKSPSCLLCPVREHCRAYHEGVQQELPVKSKKKAPKPLEMAAVILKDETDNVLIHKRPPKGLLANLWEFPNHETQPSELLQSEQLKQFIKEEYGLEIELTGFSTTIKHVFSHIIWNISVYEAKVLYSNMVAEKVDRADLKWVKREEVDSFPFPVSHQKIIQQL